MITKYIFLPMLQMEVKDQIQMTKTLKEMLFGVTLLKVEMEQQIMVLGLI
jgi:hypothetical protein